MEDINTPLRTGYYELLNNVVTLDSVGVPFYDQVPSGATYPYMYNSGVTVVEDFTKDQFGYDVTFTVTIAMKYPANYGGQADIDALANQVLNLVVGASKRPNPPPLAPYLLPNFGLYFTKLSSSVSDRHDEADGVYFFRMMKFKHSIQEFNV